MTIVSPWYQLGYIIPHAYTDLDGYQFYKVAPDGVLLVTTGLDLAAYRTSAVVDQLPAMREAVDVLAAKKVDRIAVSGVPVAASLGRARTLELLEELTARAGVPADNDLEAHIAALHHLGATRIALATRWPDHLNEALTGYLAEAGITVAALHAQGRDLAANKRAAPADDHELALRLGRAALEEAGSAGALLLPGGLWFAVHAARILEAEYGVPVLLNVTSTLWAALRERPGPLPARPEAGWSRLLASL